MLRSAGDQISSDISRLTGRLTAHQDRRDQHRRHQGGESGPAATRLANPAPAAPVARQHQQPAPGQVRAVSPWVCSSPMRSLWAGFGGIGQRSRRGVDPLSTSRELRLGNAKINVGFPASVPALHQLLLPHHSEARLTTHEHRFRSSRRHKRACSSRWAAGARAVAYRARSWATPWPTRSSSDQLRLDKFPN